MKTFEERYAAWVDGDLTGAELAAFQNELESQGGHPEEQRSMLQLGELLREHAAPEPLRNGDFFNHQLLERIRKEETPHSEPARQRASLWSPGRLAWAGAFFLVIGAAIFEFAIPKGPHENPDASNYMAQVLSTQSDDPTISASAFHSKKDDVTVVWLDGLEYLPADVATKNSNK